MIFAVPLLLHCFKPLQVTLRSFLVNIDLTASRITVFSTALLNFPSQLS
jgi:hypothetical protein